MPSSDVDAGSVHGSGKTESTTVTTPEHENDGEDIWASDEDSNAPNVGRTDEILSDLPTIKRQHMTDGYREGLSIGKAQIMQQGFDDGYPIGVVVALRVGKILGFLEGLVNAKGPSDEKHRSLCDLSKKAQSELAITALTKSLNDEMVAEAKEIPDSVEHALQKWESMLFGPPEAQS